MNLVLYFLFSIFFFLPLFADVKVGSDVFFEKGLYKKLLHGKRVGLISNQTAINSHFETTLSLLQKEKEAINLTALFAPEHGFYGDAYACEHIDDESFVNIPIYSLHGDTRRPTAAMLEKVDVLLFDIQDIGSRSYTYISTLFYCMEEAAKKKIAVIVLDRPNPMGGHIVDGTLLQEEWRSYIGYINVPYCHGMTIGELALLFNEEYKVGCDLQVIPMEGYKRGMLFEETGLQWVPTSPQIPESDTPFFYPTTGLIGHMSFVNIGIGYTLPFKVLGAPWINADHLAYHLNEQKLPGVYFQPYYFRPFFGKFKCEGCSGVRILIYDYNIFLPMTTQYTLLGILKRLYPKEFHAALVDMELSEGKERTFHKLSGDKELLRILKDDKPMIWKLRQQCKEAREQFEPIRKKYLLESYN